MNSRIRHFLDKHQKVDYFQKVIRYANKDEFRNSVLKLYNEPNYLEIKANGQENQGKIIYAIEYTNAKSGFYAVYKNILEYLYFCDYHGLIPVIKYPSNWLYSDGLDNPFEEFFEQPCKISWEGVSNSRSVVYANYYHRRLIHEVLGTRTYYQDNESEIREFGRLRKNYLRYKPEIQYQLDKDIKTLFSNNKILGVHIRGTDYQREFNGHPVYVSIQNYIEQIKKLFKKGYDSIFLATDDQNALKHIRDSFTEIPILSFTAFRSDGDVSVAMLRSKRENHKFLLGYEVIRDVVALSQCDGFIGNLSMVSLAAQIEAVANDHLYYDKIVLTNGINNNSNHLSDFETKID